jgi:hypothetical protein
MTSIIPNEDRVPSLLCFLLPDQGQQSERKKFAY